MKKEKNKNISVHPNSRLDKYLVESARRKRVVKQHIQDGKPLEELKEKGINLATPL